MKSSQHNQTLAFEALAPILMYAQLTSIYLLA